MIKNEFNFSRQLDGKIVYHDEEITTIFPAIEFGESGLINKSSIGQEVVHYGKFLGETDTVKYVVELGTQKKVDFLGGCFIRLICHVKDQTNKRFFSIWVLEDDIEFMSWGGGGLGLSYYGDNVVNFKQVLISVEESEDAIDFLDGIISSAKN